MPSRKSNSFNSKSIDNGYNNYVAGGYMAYKDNNLLANFISYNYMTLGTYKFNNSGVEQVLKTNNDIGDYAVNKPYFYQYGDDLYVITDVSMLTIYKQTSCRNANIPVKITAIFRTLY